MVPKSLKLVVFSDPELEEQEFLILPFLMILSSNLVSLMNLFQIMIRSLLQKDPLQLKNLFYHQRKNLSPLLMMNHLLRKQLLMRIQTILIVFNKN
ncbi:MAG: hypothetical protein HZR80_16375 [Candidatus Heimdallarchaeota archaeon]